jgi:hypothetical protein
MTWMDNVNNIISRYAGAGSGTASAPADPHEDYRAISQSAPPQVMSDALAHTFRSDQTPSFGEMVSSLFRQSNPDQRAGLLNHILGAIGPGALASIPGLKDLAGSRTVTPQQASQVSADQVQQIASHAESENPSIVDRVSGFYAQHPGIVKALGGAAISIAIQHIAQRRSNRA